eukprot:TRINITY_DN33418_c0_g2_i2.p2 TRINITY_DN33418_c0_g2~~TRINITY_DN33418_c0_g2_i2.p2  ORF type:complete len:177 (-),score=38.67 TRINITY_DN33418_c0_g2_i2:95-625(-)
MMKSFEQETPRSNQSSQNKMSSWGCNTRLDVFMWVFVSSLTLVGLSLLSVFITCAVDHVECTIPERYVIFWIFIILMFGSCIGCIYFCSCSLSKEELGKRQALEQARAMPLVIPYRKYQKQNSNFLSNVVYQQPSTRGFELLPQEDDDDSDELVGVKLGVDGEGEMGDANKEGNIV